MHLVADPSSLKVASASSSSCLGVVFLSHPDDSAVITLHLNSAHDGREAQQRSPVFLCRVLETAMLYQKTQPVSSCLALQ